jgi:hypothetical protein
VADEAKGKVVGSFYQALRTIAAAAAGGLPAATGAKDGN